MSQQRKPGDFSPMPPVDPAAEASPRPPVTVVVAFWVWIAAAVLVLVRVVLTLGQKNEIVNELRANPPKGIAASTYPQVAQTLIDVQVLLFVLAALFFVFFAYKVRAGRNWARLTITIVTVVGVVYTALYSGLDWETGISLLISVIPVVLINLPPSTAYFAARKRQK
ncbi:MAG TPA: hypothetical protein VHX38_29780 [Pseudonocardiaceae bacterium]|nr:hypothetical protein [Pseudonocardiaceae bacterium]